MGSQWRSVRAVFARLDDDDDDADDDDDDDDDDDADDGGADEWPCGADDSDDLPRAMKTGTVSVRPRSLGSKRSPQISRTRGRASWKTERKTERESVSYRLRTDRSQGGVYSVCR